MHGHDRTWIKSLKALWTICWSSGRLLHNVDCRYRACAIQLHTFRLRAKLVCEASRFSIGEWCVSYGKRFFELFSYFTLSVNNSCSQVWGMIVNDILWVMKTASVLKRWSNDFEMWYVSEVSCVLTGRLSLLVKHINPHAFKQATVA